MIEVVDNAKTILRSCSDIDAIVTMIELTEGHDDPYTYAACLSNVRNALSFISVEIQKSAEAILKETNERMSPT